MNENLYGIEPAYFIELLFEEESNAVHMDKLNDALCTAVSDTEMIFDSDYFNIFLLKNYLVTKNNGQKSLAGLSISKSYLTFNQDDISELEFSQYAYQPICENMQNPALLLNKYTKKILLGDWMCAFLPYRERCSLLNKFLKIVLAEFPECSLIRIPASGRLLTREECLNNPWPEDAGFINEGVNFRLFQVTDGDRPEFVADTLGLYAVGLPDLQVHFHTINASEVISRLEDYAAYMFANGDIIKDGEEVSGLYENEFWYCQHEKSIVPPYREVLDFEAGKFAAGR